MTQKEEELNKKVGKRIAELRKEMKLTQSELAEKIKLSGEYISRLERGVNAPSLQTLNLMADALEVELRDLMTFSDTGSDWEAEIQAVIVLFRNKKGRSFQRIYNLSEVREK